MMTWKMSSMLLGRRKFLLFIQIPQIHPSEVFQYVHKVVQPSLMEFQNVFIIPKRNHIPISSHSPFPLFSQSVATTNRLSVYIDLPTLDILYKWNHITYGLFYIWLFSFSIMLNVVTWISTSLFFLQLNRYSNVWIVYILFISS